MASRIQGITDEIGGDTTKLSKALESVNKSIKGTQSGLKDVNKLLKLDPSNTELVVQMNILVREYRCSGGTDTANPAAGNRCSGTGTPNAESSLIHHGHQPVKSAAHRKSGLGS